MRLIDADAFLERTKNDPLFPLVERYGLSGVIKHEPTVEAIPVEYLMNIVIENREVERRHKCDYLGDLAGHTADIIEGVILKWREENGRSVD